MFPKPLRLLPHEVETACSGGKKFQTDNLLVFVLPRSVGAPTRYAVSVPKRVDKRATHRNRLKRLVREAVRIHASRVHPGFDVVLVVVRDTDSDTLPIYTGSVERVFAKAGIV